MGNVFAATYDYFGSSAQHLLINGLDGTMAIGISFIFLAYFLRPCVESSYHGVRAYHAWRAIEKRQAVEVTTYPAWVEIFGRQGMCGWDAARIITVTLVLFSVASWGLELTMDLYALDNRAWLLTQPPPVLREGNAKNSTWSVLALDNIWPAYDGEHVLSSPDLKNIDQNNARSWYRVEDFKKVKWSKLTWTYRNGTYIEGDIVVADWDPQAKPLTLSYGLDDIITVEEVGCSSGETLKNAPVQTVNKNNETVSWGHAVECEKGPRVVGWSQAKDSRPAILLTEDTTGRTYVVVEETADKLSFLYSVWTAAKSSSVDLVYTFHIASTVRLADAVVTGIVNDKRDGKSCFTLLRAYSMRVGIDLVYNQTETDAMASPFGENPKIFKVNNLHDFEKIEGGVDVKNFSMVCFALLMVLSLTGIAWSLSLRSSTPIDIYDRDELIRAVCLQGQNSTRDLSTKPSAIRIFVRKEESGSLTVVVSDASEDNRNGCKRVFRRGGKVLETPDPAPVADTFSRYNDGFGGVAVPVGPRTVWLDGVRAGMGRSLPGRSGNFHFPTSVALSASPVPSDAVSFAGTPVALRSPAASSFVPPYGERRNPFLQEGGRGKSAKMFDSMRSFASSE